MILSFSFSRMIVFIIYCDDAIAGDFFCQRKEAIQSPRKNSFPANSTLERYR